MIKPIGHNIIIRLPNYQLEGIRQTKSGLFIPALKDKIQHDSSSGEVIAVGDKCCMCQIKDIVFFDYYSVSIGLRNNGRDVTRADATKNESTGVPIWLIENSNVVDVPELPQGLFLCIPEQKIAQHIVAKNHEEERAMGKSEMEIPLHHGVICLIRNEEVIACNGYHLIKPAYDNGTFVDGRWIRQSGLIQQVILNKESESKKRYEILFSPADSEYQARDIVFTESNIEIPVEGCYNYPQFPENTFYVEKSLILGKVKQELLAA